MDNAGRERNRGRSNFVGNLIGAGLLAAIFLLCGTSRAQVSIGIQIGAPPPPRAVAVLPPTPGPEFVWIEGYWYPVGRHYRWHAGYWTRPPYPAARWVRPHYDQDRYFVGYWDGDRGRFEHDHHWDRDRGRDRDRWHDHNDRDEHHDRGDHDRNDQH